MSEDNIDIFKQLWSKVRRDEHVGDDQLSSINEAIGAIKTGLEKFKGGDSFLKSFSDEQITRIKRFSYMLEKIDELNNPSYLDAFLSTISVPPYKLPSTLFDNEGSEYVRINLSGAVSGQNKEQLVPADIALRTLFPGSVSLKFHGLTNKQPIKIACGQWSRDFKARLTQHILSRDPVFQIDVRGKKVDVFKPEVLNTSRAQNFSYVCRRCLSIGDFDENCHHQGTRIPDQRTPSSHPIVRTVIIGTKPGERKQVRAPLNQIIREVTLLKTVSVGIVAVGFERTYRRQVVRVDYDPPIGIKLQTKGIEFGINFDVEFLKYVLDNRWIVRDLLVQRIADLIFAMAADSGIPPYHVDLLLSSVIASLSLVDIDSNVRNWIKEKNQLIQSKVWIDGAMQHIQAERTAFYERADVDTDKVRSIFNELSEKKFDETDIADKCRETLIHSAAHAVLLAGCIASGSEYDDLDYIIDGNKVILCDSTNGGNGSSELIFEFLTSREGLSVVEDPNVDGSIYKPKHFDEVFAEYILPCVQGLADRIFHSNSSDPAYTEIRRRIASLKGQKQSHPEEFQFLSRHDIRDSYCLGIGFHSLFGYDIRTAERIKEISNVCLHGCPDCISIGSNCTSGGNREKYQISRTLLDLYFEFATSRIRVKHDVPLDEIESKLKAANAVIMTLDIGSSNHTEERLKDRVLEISGRQVDSKYVKFAGFWIETFAGINDSMTYRYCSLLVLV